MNEHTHDTNDLQVRIAKLEAELEKLKALPDKIEAIRSAIPLADMEQCKRDVNALRSDSTSLKETIVPEALARLVTPEVIGKVITKETMTKIVDDWYRRGIDSWKFWIQL